MPSYLITGTSRGIGFELVRQLSANPANFVIGLVRNKPATEEKIARELTGKENIRIVEGDLTNYASLKKAAEDVANITVTGSLDYLIANAVYMPSWSALAGMGDLAANDPAHLEADLLDTFKANVVGNIHLFSLFLPLIQQGQAKKVIAITSGMADLDFITKYSIVAGAPYTISKAAMNAAVAKFGAQYQAEGILFLGVSPGLVDTSQPSDAAPTPEQMAQMGEMVRQFATYAPSFKGPISVGESVGHVLDVIHRADVNKGYSGAFLSHYGNKQWL